jgi:hypothetical protein
MLLHWLTMEASDSSSIPSSYTDDLQTTAILANPNLSMPFSGTGRELMSEVQSSDSSIPSPYEQDFSDNAAVSTALDFSLLPSDSGSKPESQVQSSDSSVPSPYGQDVPDYAAMPTLSFLADPPGQNSDSSIPSGELILIKLIE